MSRPSGRQPGQLRELIITRNFTMHAEGSVLVREILSRLSPVERCFLVHAIFEGWAVEEAQRRCDGPPGTPAYRLRQLLDKVGEMIG